MRKNRPSDADQVGLRAPPRHPAPRAPRPPLAAQVACLKDDRFGFERALTPTASASGLARCPA